MGDIFDLLERARILMSLKRYTDAERKLQEALGIDPVNIEALLLLCRCKLLLNKLRECEALAKNILAINPAIDEALSLLAEVYAAQGDPGMAEITIREALTWDAQNADYMAQFSRYLVMQGDEPAAVQVAVDALKIYPKHVPSLAALGWAKFTLDDYEESLDAFHRGLALNPNNPVLLHHIGTVLSETGESEGAKAMFLDALRNDPNFDDAAINIAGLSYRSTLLYRLHYKLVFLFRQSHISRICFFTGAFLFLQSIAEPAWEEYTILGKLVVTPAWVFLLIMLSVFIVPAAGNLPVIFKKKYRHLFNGKAKAKTIATFLLYILSIGLLIAGWFNDQFTARWLMYASLSSLIGCLVMQALLGSGQSVKGGFLLIFLAACLYTWLYLTAGGNIRYGGFYGLWVMLGTNIIGLGLSIFRKFRD